MTDYGYAIDPRPAELGGGAATRNRACRCCA